MLTSNNMNKRDKNDTNSKALGCNVCVTSHYIEDMFKRSSLCIIHYYRIVIKQVVRCDACMTVESLVFAECIVLRRFEYL